MKRLLLPLLAALALPTAVNAEFKTKFLGCYGDIFSKRLKELIQK